MKDLIRCILERLNVDPTSEKCISRKTETILILEKLNGNPSYDQLIAMKTDSDSMNDKTNYPDPNSEF